MLAVHLANPKGITIADFVYFPPPAERAREFEIALLPRPPVNRSVSEAELRPTTAHYFCAESEKDYEDWRRKLRENGDEIEAAGGEVQYRKWRTNPTAKDGGGQPVQVPSQRRRRPDRDRDGDAPTRAGVAEPPDGQHGLQDFDILNMLGEGAFGKVLLVRHRTEKKQYAMKVMLKEAVAKANNEEQVTKELESMIKIQHPNIVQIHYAFQNRQRLYLVVDFMSGGELYHQLKGVGRFSESQARFICAEISLALAYLHDKEDMAYRDLKPENVMFDAEGHIRLIDFGKLAPDRQSFWKRPDTLKRWARTQGWPSGTSRWRSARQPAAPRCT